MSADGPRLIAAGRLRGKRLPEPSVFCEKIRQELAAGPRRTRLGWWRGALALCDWYADADRQRFAAVLSQLAAGPDDSAAAQGARWLLARWRGQIGPEDSC